jgi:hypothetical protein
MRRLHYLYLLLRQPVQLIRQLIDLPVGRVALALEGGLFVVITENLNSQVKPQSIPKIAFA